MQLKVTNERIYVILILKKYIISKKCDQDAKPKREEWMLQLPKKLNSYGLGPRSFSKSNGAGGDSSAWTTGKGFAGISFVSIISYLFRPGNVHAITIEIVSQ